MDNQNAMNDLGSLMRMSKIVRKAYRRGEITYGEYNDWLDDLRKPRGFWNVLMYRVFGL